MQNDLEKLNRRILELEAENKRLKEGDHYGMALFGFDFLFENVKLPVFIIKFEASIERTSIEKANKSALELVKYTQEELKNITPFDLGIFASVTEVRKFQNNLADDEKVSYLAKIKAKNEQSISSEITLHKFTAADSVYFIVFQRNIGNQLKVVEALRQSEFRFLQMAENVVEGIIISENSKRVFINSSICKITGYSKDELRDMDEFTLAREDEIPRLKAFKDKLAGAPSGVHAIEFWIKTKQDQEKCIRNHYTFSQRNDGYRSTYIITSDITSQKRIEQALRKSQVEFRMLAENSPDFITRYNRDLKYVYANQTVEQITNIPISQFVGSNNLELNLEAETVSFLEDMHLEVFRTGRSIKFEFRLNVDSRHIVFQAHLVPELSAQGVVESVLNVSRDISQIKEVERSLKEEKQYVIEENELIGRQLKLWCNMLCEAHKSKTPEPDCLNPIIRIADWAQIRFIEHDFIPKTHIANKLVKDFFEQNSQLIEKQNIEASLFLPVHEISIRTDERLLHSTLSYLLENALQATSSGKIEIGLDIYNDYQIVFFVKDTGKGIHSEYLESIFEPFVHIDKPNNPGLGLSIAKKYVELLQGQIWCLSSVGTGSTFCFTHPAQIEASLIQAKSGDIEGKWKNKNILIVEDTDNNYILLESLLRKYQPRLTRAITGEEAINIVKNQSDWDLVLMDIQLPGMNGYEATTEIRKFNTSVPIIAQTAYAMYDDVVKALDAGCNDFIAKPIKVKKFLSSIEKYLDQ